MRNDQTWRWWLRLAVGGVWALAVGAAFAPAQARAGCGDGLVPLHAGRQAPRGPAAAPESRDAQRQAPQPCSGPHCSRAPLIPGPAPGSTAPRGVDDFCTLVPILLLPAPRPLAEPGDRAPGCPVHRASQVYRPPR
jgi:hypothetical protein